MTKHLAFIQELKISKVTLKKNVSEVSETFCVLSVTLSKDYQNKTMTAITARTGYTLDQVEYISPNQFIQSFHQCPSSLYVRDDSELNKSRIQSMKLDLMSPVLENDGKSSMMIIVLEPIKFFTLSEEQISKWKLGSEVQAGLNYVLNGNTRLLAVRELIEENKHTFADVPIQQIILSDDASDIVLMNLQTKFNDTTQKHSTLSKIQAIANFIERHTAAGAKSSDINKLCMQIMGVSAGYISQVKRFIDTPELTDIQKNDRKYLFEKLNDGQLSFDSCVTIMQHAEKTGASYKNIIDSLQDEYKPVYRPGQSLFSRNQIADWAKKDIAQATGESTESSSSPETKTEKVVTEEDLTKAKEDIKIGLNFVKNETQLVKNEPTSEPKLDVSVYKEATIKLAKILKNLIEYVPPESYRTTFTQTSELMEKLVDVTLNNPAVAETIDENKLVSISKSFEAICSSLAEPAEAPATEVSAEKPKRGRKKKTAVVEVPAENDNSLPLEF